MKRFQALAMIMLPLASGGAELPSSSTTPPAPAPGATELATFGGGCFWCLEAVFEQLDGVKSVLNGYAGGTTANPTYKAVCSGDTGHAEVVQIEFDPKRIAYAQLLEVFWQAHDPTTLDRQGADVGTQYRSVVFYHTEAQRLAAQQSKADAAKRFDRPVVTEIQPLTRFYKAESYHQDYYRNHSEYPYCQTVIRPKLKELKRKGTIRQG
jgi:peptide-methionine (S)-S-oxide reductase